MSGFSTLIFLKEDFKKKDLLNFLDTINGKYYLDSNSKNCYELWVKEVKKKGREEFEFEELIIINYYNAENIYDISTVYNEEFYNELIKVEEKYSFFIDITFMRHNIETTAYLLEILDTLKINTSFCFLNRKTILDKVNIVDKNYILEFNPLSDTILLSSDTIQILLLELEKIFPDLGL